MTTKERRETAKERARAAMCAVAGARRLISYQELSDRIDAYNPRSPSFHDLITEIALEEHRAGRGLLSAVVVRKDTGQPGDGFFEAAEEELERALPDRDAFWRDELERVYEAQRGESRAPVAERAISVRLDPEAERALDLLVAAGVNRSDAIRQALVDSADRARRSSLAEEARALAEDPEDRAAISEIATFMDALSAER
jgi:Arc/MetJ-type ribon-helix-helix transcriptional regulator